MLLSSASMPTAPSGSSSTKSLALPSKKKASNRERSCSKVREQATPIQAPPTFSTDAVIPIPLKSKEQFDFEDVEFDMTFLRSTTPPPLVYGSIDRGSPVKEAEKRERAALDAILADKEREEKRLRDLRAANDQHERDLRERQRQREQEEQSLAELRSFSDQRDGCRKFHIAACETALRSSHASTQDAIDLQSWRGVAMKFGADLSPPEMVAVYLGSTPLAAFVEAPLPFSIPLETRF
jgi:hypothetical protein